MTQSPITDTTRIALLLCASLGPDAAAAKPLGPQEFYRFAQAVQKAGMKLRDLNTSETEDQLPVLVEAANLDLARIQTLLVRGVALSFRIQEWMEVGIWAISRLDKSYPVRLKARLGPSAPPVLFGRGPVEILDTNAALGVVGSREATAEALQFATLLGEAAAAREWTIVSGSARGVDRESMGAALNVGGSVIGVEHSGLKKSALERGLRDYFRTSLVLISPYAPEAGFSVGNAMGRNKLVYALSAGTVAVHSGTSGGTWEGVLENLKQQWVPVWIPADIDSPGRAGLLKAGATEFDGDWPPVDHTAMEPAIAPTEPSAPLITTSAITDYAQFRTAAEARCESPQSADDLATALHLKKTQVSAWIRQATTEGWLVKAKAKGPWRYIRSDSPDPPDGQMLLLS